MLLIRGFIMHGCWQRGYCKLPRRSDWITKRSPLLVQQYLKLIRFDKPIGTWLLFWPGAWSLTLATSLEKKKLNLHTDIWPELSTNTIIDTFLLNINFPDLNIFLYFVLGSFLMRNAGCIINDIFDKDFDSHVKRTQERPLASNKLSTKQALNLLTFHLVGAFVILLQLNTYTVILGLVSMIPTVTYPLAKRYFPWPQLHLGIVFNWGALMGWSAIFGSLQPILPISILSIACICWIVLYDTVYAHQVVHKSDPFRAFWLPFPSSYQRLIYLMIAFYLFYQTIDFEAKYQIILLELIRTKFTTKDWDSTLLLYILRKGPNYSYTH
ncbi:4-hydroxybenzoate polyprenyltransferase, mitochondrial-like isoform X2 [Gordionus sp. m RMFG-2023]|uniref:4-hydroxybenzoate polyprenyltransferase, mitochondrial-like isoform X2 n=1 Tax=Gordionus sp. m RMFG-2023 TaxID=3053472 RepID=UPI0031FC885C